MQLAGQIALITGGSRGIGRATALAFAREGADIAFCHLDDGPKAEATAAEITALGRRALHRSVDVADIDALPAALERAMAVDGPSVVTVECSADEIPPFAAFLNRQPANQVVEQQITTLKENRFHVPSSA